MIPTSNFRRVPSLAVLIASCLTGCAAWDDFSWRKMNTEVFWTPSNPMEVIKSGTDGSERRRAILALREPQASGGSQQDQDACVGVLCKLAATDGNPLCRMAAIEMLGGYRDPRAVGGLKDAYYGATSFGGEQATVLRRLALTGLGKSGDAAAAEMLVKVLREPDAEGPDVDRDAKTQERITAARALARFENIQVTAALVEAMGKSDDVGLKRVTHESLVSITGENLPADAQEWNNYLRQAGGKQPRRRATLGDGIMQAVGWK